MGMVTQLDDAIGQIVAKLTSLGILNNTIIAFTSDNGGSPPIGGSSYPLRGMKGTLYEGGHKVRAFISLPTLTSYVNSGLFHISDWLPTLIGGAVGAS
jgi:arylsulfatase A-like enzyme